VKKMKNVRTPQGGFFLTHTVGLQQINARNIRFKKYIQCLTTHSLTIRVSSSA